MSAFKTWLNGLTSKTTPVDADEMYLRDSVGAASNKVTWANLKATLLTYFDTAYLKLTGGTLAGGTVTASSPVLTTTQTWNNAAVTFAGKVTNITDTASASDSLIEDWQIGGSSRFSISSLSGANVKSADGGGKVLTMGSIYGTSYFSVGGGTTLNWHGGVFGCPAGIWVGYDTSALKFGNSSDVILLRDAANTLAQRNGTNAQAFRTYGTYTDASNYRRVAIAMTTAGVATLTPEGAGTGASGNVLHISGLPTSNPGAGILWNDAGTVKVGT